MKQIILTQFPWPWLPSLGLLIFFVIFLLLIRRVCQHERQPIYQSAANLPLYDEDTSPFGQTNLSKQESDSHG